MAAALTAVGIGALGAPGAAQARTSFCSPSGDYCTSTFRENGRRFAGLRTAALYGPGPRYTLSLQGLTAPNAAAVSPCAAARPACTPPR